MPKSSKHRFVIEKIADPDGSVLKSLSKKGKGLKTSLDSLNWVKIQKALQNIRPKEQLKVSFPFTPRKGWRKDDFPDGIEYIE